MVNNYKPIFKKAGDYFYVNSYLEMFWPKVVRGHKVWFENRWLLSRYVNSCLLLHRKKSGWSCLDISTGPSLAPTIALAPILVDLQLSDFSVSARKLLRFMSMGYWRGYAKEIIKLEKGKSASEDVIEDRLKQVDILRKKRPVLRCDLLQKNVLGNKVDVTKFDLFTMHFVADSITRTKDEYFKVMSKVVSLQKRGDALLMSALVDCAEWEDGVQKYPSPNIKLNEIGDVLKESGFTILSSEQLRTSKSTGHEGSLSVILALKS